MSHQIQLKDGRKLEYRLAGAEDGFPLIWIHGTPGSGVIYTPLDEQCLQKGMKLVSVTRAGYGNSSRDAGRRVVSAVADVEALTTELGMKKCFVGGWSGGGPHALACAARLPGCVAVLSIASIGMYNVDDLDFLAGQGEDNVQEFTAALEGESKLREFTENMRSSMLGAGVSSIIESLSSLLPKVDVDVLHSSDAMGQYMSDSFGDGLSHNADGWIDDDLAFVQPWGFELSEISVPVAVYQGSEDKMVPFAHGEWLAKHIPPASVKAHLYQGQGHISIASNYLDTMIDELLSFK